jgi:DivIVA domain-containing protein
MIDLTPLEVRQKKADFPRGLRGYDPGHVDDFLNLVAERLEALIKENRKLAEELTALRSSAGEYKDREKALTEALVSAQQMREEMREQTSKEAALMRREAEHDAQRVRDGALRAIEKEEETLRRLRARQRQLVEGYRGMLERELRELAVVADSLEEAATSSEGSEGASAPRVRAQGADEEAPAAVSRSGARPAAPVLKSAAEAAVRAPAAPTGRGAGEPGPRRPGSRDDAAAPDEPPRATREPGRPPAAEPSAGAEDDPWAVPPPAAAPRPVTDERGHGRDRFAAPAASLDPKPPVRRSPDARGEEPPPPRGGDEPDWLAAILKEE